MPYKDKEKRRLCTLASHRRWYLKPGNKERHREHARESARRHATQQVVA